jgi:archaellum biogenesis ATPase FlaH
MHPDVDIPLELPGLNQFIPSIPSGRLIVIKGGQNPAKSYLAQLIGSGAITVGIEPHYITSRGTSDLKRQLSHFFPDRGYFHASEESSPLGWASLLNSKSMLIIDSFSDVLYGRDPADCRHILEEVRKKCKNSDSLLLLVLDDHILERSVEELILHLADGIISFMTVETSDGVKRYLRIQRWTNDETFDYNIFSTFTEDRMHIELRHRII